MEQEKPHGQSVGRSERALYFKLRVMDFIPHE